jgi:hypothetical protein
MSFGQRERKRKKHAASLAAQALSRRNPNRSPDSASKSKWWLTIVNTTTCCAVCGGVLRQGREMVYRHTPREARCTNCAEGLSYRPSTKWELQKKTAA